MKNLPDRSMPHRTRRREAGLMLAECLIYISVWSLMLGLAFAAFYRVWDNAVRLRRSAGDIGRTLAAGERWRDDIHRATGVIQLISIEDGSEPALQVPQASGEVVYLFTGTNILRRANPGSRWLEALAGVKASRVHQDRRGQTVAWRWELELNSGRKKPVVRPLFTFQAASPVENRP